MERFLPSINEAHITPAGELEDFSAPSHVIWSDDSDLTIGMFVAYEKDGKKYAMYFDRVNESVLKTVYIKEYNRDLLVGVPEEIYEDAYWIYDAEFLETDNDFHYSKYAIVDNNDEDIAKTVYVLMAGSDKFRYSSKRVIEINDEKELVDLISSEGLEPKLVESLKRINESEFTEDVITKLASDNGIDISQYDMNEILLGMPIELEHGTSAQPDANLTNDDPLSTLKIVLAHLKEFDRYYSELLIPAEREIGIYDAQSGNQSVQESLFFNKRVPLFEDYTNDNFRMTDWFAGANGELYASDGRAMRDFDFEGKDQQPTEDEHNALGLYMDIIKGAFKLFKNMTPPHKSGDILAFGFSGPRIKHGPYAGSDSWWTFEHDLQKNSNSLINDVTGQIYVIHDPTEFRKTISELMHELYESVNENHTECPACGAERTLSCKCASFVKHGFDELVKGHGYKCANGHRWSYQTADNKAIILI